MFKLDSIGVALLFATYIGGSYQLPSGNWGPQDGSLARRQQINVQQWIEHVEQQRAKLKIVKSTNLANGRMIDWISIGSQAETIASAPPTVRSLQAVSNRPIPELESGNFQRGPPGTVPVLRHNLDQINPNVTLAMRLGKSGPPGTSNDKQREGSAYAHWHASVHQDINSIGSTGRLSMFEPYLQSSGDFSLIQTNLGRWNAANKYQSLEAGWQHYPAQIRDVHLFTFYNTNGYEGQGDNIGGYNRDVKGWIQVDDTIFPGTTFPGSHSVINGPQYDMGIEWQLFQGNWWLSVLDRWIGYYPANLYGDTGNSLAGGASRVYWYGEIYQTENDLTTSDMGSGNFPEAQFAKAAYMRNIVVRTTSGTSPYSPTGTIISDGNRYRLEPHFNSGSTWGSYAYVGGPGAGGTVGG